MSPGGTGPAGAHIGGPPPPTPSVMIVEDHRLVRSAIREALDGADLRVVAEAATGEQGIEEALRTRPDVLLVDIDLPGLSGLDLVRELAVRLPNTAIVMLTISNAIDDAVAAMEAGAAGYLTKDMSPAALRRAVLAAAAGDLAMPRRMAAETMHRLARPQASQRPASGQAGGLSRRELDVIRLLAEGLTDRQIANALSISTRTVETHVATILRKLDVPNRATAARIYRQR